jgi:hypothetical protein
MAQSNYTPIQLYRTSTAAAVPTAGNLAAGELAINLTDEKLYFKNAGGAVTLLASSASASNVGTVTSVAGTGTVNGLTLTGTVTSSGSLTLGGTLTGTASININGTVGATTPTTGAFTSVSLTAGSTLAWNSDVGFSRATAATLSLGDGTAGTSSGTLVLAKTTFAGNANLTSPSSGNLQLGTGSTTGAGGSLSLTGLTASGTVSANSLTLALGAVGTPSYTFTGDLNTGMWSPAADTIAFSTNGAEVARLTSAGYLEAVYSDEVVALGNSGTATTINLNQGNVFTATLTGNCTFTLANSNANSNRGSSFTLILTNDGTAGRTVAWAGGTFRFPGGAAALSRTTTANAVDIWVFFTPNNGTTWYGNISMKNMIA